jgi:SAM-dependent methyltransferase
VPTFQPVRRLLRQWHKLRQRLASAVFRECRPALSFLASATQAALKDRLLAEDSRDKTAIVIGSSTALARAVGLHKTRLLVLEYPEFTLDNLALLNDNYDFLIADRSLHLCDDLDDAVRETLRVLRPGGWFIHATSLLDLTLGLPWDPRRLPPSALRRLFDDGATTLQAGCTAGGLMSWVIGRKGDSTREIVPTVHTRQRQRRWYPAVRAPANARLGVVAIARNEAPYLLEWIAHYRTLGFEHIAIYDNDSNDASTRILMPLAKAGVIDATYWHVRPGIHKQEAAYRHALTRLRNRIDWCLIVDLDEFLVLNDGMTVADILPADPAVGAVAIGWRVFGSAGAQRREIGLTIERFTKGDPTNEGTIKSLVRPRDVIHMHTHFPKLVPGSKILDALGNMVAPANPANPPLQGPARIHHYCTRSWEEFECKRSRGRGGGPHGSMRSQSLFAAMDRNSTTVTDALRLVSAVTHEIEHLRKIVRG